jgi:hypothetical protein
MSNYFNTFKETQSKIVVNAAEESYLQIINRHGEY